MNKQTQVEVWASQMLLSGAHKKEAEAFMKPSPPHAPPSRGAHSQDRSTNLHPGFFSTWSKLRSSLYSLPSQRSAWRRAGLREGSQRLHNGRNGWAVVLTLVGRNSGPVRGSGQQRGRKKLQVASLARSGVARACRTVRIDRRSGLDLPPGLDQRGLHDPR